MSEKEADFESNGTSGMEARSGEGLTTEFDKDVKVDNCTKFNEKKFFV